MCVDAALAKNPKMIIGVAKPVAPSKIYACLKNIHFVVSDNNHQMRLFHSVGVKTIQLKLVEEFPTGVVHRPRPAFSAEKPAVLCYHGNANHFLSLVHDHFMLLNAASLGVPFVVVAVVSPEEVRRMRTNALKTNITILIQPYNPHNVFHKLRDCDVGLVPQFRAGLRDQSSACVHDDCQSIDTTVRYKLTANAGRAYVFMQLGVPIIADSVTEVAEVVGYNSLGILLDSAEHAVWLEAVRMVVSDFCVRKYLADRSRQYATRFLRPSVEAMKLRDYVTQFV